MINERFHRTYVDCEELLRLKPAAVEVDNPVDPLTCCPECATIRGSLDTPSRIGSIYESLGGRAIEVFPKRPDGVNPDWALNISALVCCKHVHHALALTREDWLRLVVQVGATPFYTQIEEARESLGNAKSYLASPVFGRVARSRTSGSSAPRVASTKSYSCIFCGSSTTNSTARCDSCSPKR